MVNDKDISSSLKLLPKNAVYYFTQAKIARALPSEELRKIGNSLDLKGNSFSTVEEAICETLKMLIQMI